jgi:3,4-dihydroxy 2-butanone 4-phosphate synthase/GTP cyclohydrolase II
MQTASSPSFVVKNLVKTRIPTGYGEFTLYLYSEHGKEHLALVTGDVAGKSGVPVRVHSECLTGDVFGSRRCDCGDQLKHTLQYLGRSPCGILVYLRQEGRGIGLRKKMEAYNLQDQGMDTVEANIELGHQPDERDYGIAARILGDLGVASIRIITNNPHKVDELKGHGIEVEARIPIEVGQHAENLDYLRSKAEKMAHLLTFRERTPEHHDLAFIEPLIDQLTLAESGAGEMPFVTLSYAQSLDGSIAVQPQVPYALRSKQSLVLTHFLRAHHDAVLVGVNTILSDDPQLNVRHYEGVDPRVVVVDSQLRTPPVCRVLQQARQPPIIVTTAACDPARREQLASLGAEVVEVGAEADGSVNLRDALKALRGRGLRSLMVEGGSRIICTFLKQHLVNYCVITITPKIIGGLRAVDGSCRTGEQPPLNLTDCQYRTLGSDLIAYGPVAYV